MGGGGVSGWVTKFVQYLWSGLNDSCVCIVGFYCGYRCAHVVSYLAHGCVHISHSHTYTCTV